MNVWIVDMLTGTPKGDSKVTAVPLGHVTSHVSLIVVVIGSDHLFCLNIEGDNN